MKRLKNRRHHCESGFTIIELMIATAVFSVILLVLVYGVIQITNTYNRGITENKTQNVARNIVGTISQSVQYGGGVSGTQTFKYNNVTYSWFCIGSQQFTYAQGQELTDLQQPGTDQTNYGLMVYGDACDNGNKTLNASGVPDALANGTELLDPSMRISNLSVTPSPYSTNTKNLYDVSVTVAYGDDDLLNNPTSASPNCKGGAGEQFCTVSTLDTSIDNRVGQ